jgi:hypothetical protein
VPEDNQNLPSEPAKQQPQPPQSVIATQFEAFAAPVLHTVFRGILAVTIGPPLEFTLVGIAQCSGRILGMLTSAGPLVTLLKTRDACKKAFVAGMDSVPIQQPGAMPQGSVRHNLRTGATEFNGKPGALSGS